MKKGLLLLTILGLIFSQNNFGKDSQENQKTVGLLSKATVQKITKELTDKFGKTAEARLERGVNQAASLWIAKDGSEADFEKFCLENFIGNDKERDAAFDRIVNHFETLWGNFGRISLKLKEPITLIGFQKTGIDDLFGAYDVSAHMVDDFFNNKIAFYIILNFPGYSLPEKNELGAKWSRKEWAYARLGDVFISRVPADLIQKSSEVVTYADSYISDYNIFMGNLVDEKRKTYFPKDMRLITHWNLRDELKSNYDSKENGLYKQKMIYEVMKNIISQTIPQEVINSDKLNWNPFLNKVYKDGKEVNFVKEPDTRYQHLLNSFMVQKEIDNYQPLYNNFIKRGFELWLEMPQEQVEKIFTDFVSSPQIKKVAELIKKRLGRNLEPFDIWYNGFKSRSGISEDELTARTRKLYPEAGAMQKDLKNILVKLGFTKERAEYLADKIQVDGAIGSGHALGASMKGEKAHLRTRINEKGMDYKGYNIAVHEFGHNVEQTLSLYDVDNYMMNGVPNTAFTEALAFAFQGKDLEILGMNETNPDLKYLKILDLVWSGYEIMGVSLVDMNVWKWLYANPNATAGELKEAVIKISKEIWNKYYADAFGIKDQTILAIYSHMIDNPLYLSAYPLGHLIEFQISKQFEGKSFAAEVERMFTFGRTTPQYWMINATGKDLSPASLLELTDEALKKIK